MSFTLDAATARLMREMGSSETTVIDALVASTALMHSAVLAQQHFPDAPHAKAQSALVHLNKMVAGLVEAQGEARRVHSQLLDIAREMGATESPDCPKHAMDTAAPTAKAA
ncbi:MAG: hypothetical protein WBA51_19505 [Erythrobacter sp.]